jgi:catalase
MNGIGCMPKLSESFSNRSVLARLLAIAVAVFVVALAFAYTAGWLSPSRLTPTKIVDALSQRGGNPIGHRRNHAKGTCFLGAFVSNGVGAHFSRARVFAAGQYPVIGRFAIATGNPEAADATARVRSMAIVVGLPNGEEWRSGMNNSPVFAVSTPRAFYEQVLAARVDPRTGNPDPVAMRRFNETHPETAVFNRWAETAPWTTSWADQTYSSLNAFVFVDRNGNRRAVRWAMVTTVAPGIATKTALARLGPDFLSDDLKARLRRGPLVWHLVVTLAAPGDPTNNATISWPANRWHIDVGALVVTQAQDEVDGACRNINFDPLVLPVGILPSDDPLLPARSSTYFNSFDRRMAEASHYRRGPDGAKP